MIDESEGRFEFRFDTAWSPPEPIFATLADRPECEDLRIDIQGFNEGWLFAYRAEVSCGFYDIESIPRRRSSTRRSMENPAPTRTKRTGIQCPALP